MRNTSCSVSAIQLPPEEYMGTNVGPVCGHSKQKPEGQMPTDDDESVQEEDGQDECETLNSHP